RAKLEQRRFSRAIPADQADPVTFLQGEGNISECFDLKVMCADGNFCTDGTFFGGVGASPAGLTHVVFDRRIPDFDFALHGRLFAKFCVLANSTPPPTEINRVNRPTTSQVNASSG